MPPSLLLPLSCTALLLLLLPAAARAQGPECALHDQVVDRLASKYGETRQGMGIANNNAVVEVFASDATGSWTITVSSPDGMTCLVASGQGYEAMTEELPAKGEPA